MLTKLVISIQNLAFCPPFFLYQSRGRIFGLHYIVFVELLTYSLTHFGHLGFSCSQGMVEVVKWRINTLPPPPDGGYSPLLRGRALKSSSKRDDMLNL